MQAERDFSASRRIDVNQRGWEFAGRHGEQKDNGPNGPLSACASATSASSIHPLGERPKRMTPATREAFELPSCTLRLATMLRSGNRTGI